jgi:NADH-quinone oxidoreductase subunit M
VIFGEVASERVAKLQDLDRRELVILGSLAGAVLLFGVWPAPMLEVMHATVEHLVEHVSHSKVAMAVTGL